MGSFSVAAAGARGTAATTLPMTSPMTKAEGLRHNGSIHRDALILQHLPLVRMIAVQVLHTLPNHVELEDLEQAGTIGLLAAAERFDSSKDVVFAAYAKHRIRGAILDSLRGADPITRDLRREKKKIEAAASSLEQQLKREVTETELAEALSMDLGRLRQIRLHLFNAQCLPVATQPGEDWPEQQHAGPAQDRPDFAVSRDQLRNLVAKVVADLPERWRAVLGMYYVDELTMNEIGRVIGVNESRVSQIHKAAIKALGDHLKGLGVTSAAA